MFLRVNAHLPGGVVYPELAGARVLITGLNPLFGVDVARTLADHGARLALHTTPMCPEISEMVAFVAQTAEDTKHFDDPLASKEEAIKFAQGHAVRAFGGLEYVINIISFTETDLCVLKSAKDIEQMVSCKLSVPLLLGRVLANRMNVTMTQGQILNIVTTPAAFNEQQMALNGLIKTALSTLTRGEAEDWAEQDVRINAVGPVNSVTEIGESTMTSEADIAALALFLGSDKAKGLTGHVFDPNGLSNSETLPAFR